jgi:hypothetical protein
MIVVAIPTTDGYGSYVFNLVALAASLVIFKEPVNGLLDSY